jgi:hypothetical protein
MAMVLLHILYFIKAALITPQLFYCAGGPMNFRDASDSQLIFLTRVFSESILIL